MAEALEAYLATLANEDQRNQARIKQFFSGGGGGAENLIC